MAIGVDDSAKSVWLAYHNYSDRFCPLTFRRRTRALYNENEVRTDETTRGSRRSPTQGNHHRSCAAAARQSPGEFRLAEALKVDQRSRNVLRLTAVLGRTSQPIKGAPPMLVNIKPVIPVFAACAVAVGLAAAPPAAADVGEVCTGEPDRRPVRPVHRRSRGRQMGLTNTPDYGCSLPAGRGPAHRGPKGHQPLGYGPTKLVTALAGLFSVIAAIVVMVLSMAYAHADQQQGNGSTPMPPPVTTTVMATPTPTPGPVGATGGAGGSSNPGSSCSTRLVTRNAPPTPSPLTSWNTNSAVGWPFGWTGGGVYAAVPTTAPSVGCSR